ncbi:uncharacterized protein LOC144451461 [Glandiceps talaboti]
MASTPEENRNSLISYEKCVLCGCSKEQYEELKKRVADSKNRITMMETDYLQSTLRAENDLANCKEELRVMKERYKRLEDSHASLQRTNQELEDKVLQVAAKFEKEKQYLGKEMMTLTSRLVDVRCKLNEREDENCRLKKDCELAVQLLQCAPSSNYLTHKVSSLPHDLQYRVHKVMAEELQTQQEDTHEPLLYTPNDDGAPNLAGRVYDRVSTDVITKAMQMRELDEMKEKVKLLPVRHVEAMDMGTQTIQPFQGSLSAKMKKNIANGTSEKGNQVMLGEETLENLSKSNDNQDCNSNNPQNLMDAETADLIDFSQTPTVNSNTATTDGAIPNQELPTSRSSSRVSSRGSSRRSSFDSEPDNLQLNSKRRHSSSSSTSTDNAVSHRGLHRVGSHSSREIEYGPDLVKQLSPSPLTTQPKPVYKIHGSRGVVVTPQLKGRGPVKPGMMASHKHSGPGRSFQHTTPPASPAHFIANAVPPPAGVHTDV